MKNENFIKLFKIIGLMLLMIFITSSTSAYCKNNNKKSTDDTAYYDDEYNDETNNTEDSYAPVKSSDLEKMQKRIDNITKDPGVDAGQIINQVENGNLKGLTKRMSKGNSSFTSPVYWFFMIFISVVGMGFFWSGKKSGDFPFIFSGAVMSIFPYFVTSMWIFIPLSVVLIVLPFYLHRF